jgi:hypothetical protein
MDFRIVTRIAWFVVGLLAIDRGAGFLLEKAALGVTTGDGVGRINHALLHASSTVYVLGSSRAAHHIDPKVITQELGVSAYNGGHDGQGIYYARMLEVLLLAQQPKIKVLLVQTEPMDLFEGNPHKAKMFAPYVDRHPLIHDLLAEDYREQIKFFSKLYRYNSVSVPLFIALAKRTSASPEENGYVPLFRNLVGTEPITEFEPAPGLRKSLPRVIKKEVAEQYRQLVRDARKAGIQVVFFTGPRYRSVPPHPKEVEAWEAYRTIAREEGAIYEEIDERTHPMFVDGKLFDDPSHLNQTGAEMFTHLLAQRIQHLIAR